MCLGVVDVLSRGDERKTVMSSMVMRRRERKRMRWAIKRRFEWMRKR